jgi:hypothetical protein
MLEKDRKKPAGRRVAPKEAPKPATAARPETRPAAPVVPAADVAPRVAVTVAPAPAAPTPAAPTRATAPAPRTVSAAERLRMVAEAAYYRARQRGSAPGDPVRDWIEAEAEIDAQLLEKI